MFVDFHWISPFYLHLTLLFDFRGSCDHQQTRQRQRLCRHPSLLGPQNPCPHTEEQRLALAAAWEFVSLRTGIHIVLLSLGLMDKKSMLERLTIRN